MHSGCGDPDLDRATGLRDGADRDLRRRPLLDGSGETAPLPAYTRLDLPPSYPLNPHTRIFGRIENLTNVRYQDPAGYNNAGLSAYLGLTWRQ